MEYSIACEEALGCSMANKKLAEYAGRVKLKKYCVYVVDTEKSILGEGIDSLTLSRKEYSEFLGLLSSHHVLDAILNSQNFRCGSCRSFSLPAKALYSALEKIQTDDEVAEMMVSALRIPTEFGEGDIDLLDQPDEIREKIFREPEGYHDRKDVFFGGNYIIEQGEVCRFPFDECVFIFNSSCECTRILQALVIEPL